MFFINAEGKLLEGEPLSNHDKYTLDRMIEFFHDSPGVCAGYHPSYDHKCLKLALAMRNRFDISQKADWCEVVEEPDLELLAVEEHPSPEHVQEGFGTSPGAVSDDSLPF